MGTQINELPATSGIKKEDILIVEDTEGTKRGTVQQLEEALGVKGMPTDEQTFSAINTWLNAHPEATTTVLDNSLTVNKFVKSMYSMTGSGADNRGIKDCSEILRTIVNKIKEDFLESRHLDRANVIIFESGKYVFKKGVEIPPYCKIRIQGAVEIISEVNGALFTLLRKTDDLSEINYEKKAMYTSPFIDGNNGGLVIYNKNYPNGNIDGSIAIQFGSNEDYGIDKSVSFTGINNVTIIGFNEGIRICSYNTYCIKVSRCHISRCSKAINYYSLTSSSNSGENFIYENCIIEGSDIVSNHMYQFIDENYINCSIDYNTVLFHSEIEFPRSKIYFNGGHIEGWGVIYNNLPGIKKGIVSEKWGNSYIVFDGVCFVSSNNGVKAISVPYYGKIDIQNSSWDVINDEALDGDNIENWFVSDNVLSRCELHGKIPFRKPFSTPASNAFISGNYSDAYMSTSEGNSLNKDTNINTGYLLKYGLGGDNTVKSVSNLTFKKVSDFYWDSAKTMRCRQMDLYATSNGETFIEIETPFLEINKIRYAIFDSPYINGYSLKAKVEYYGINKNIIKTIDYHTNDEKQKSGIYMQSTHFTLENNVLNAQYCKISLLYNFGNKNTGDEVSICPIFVEAIN